ncbi:MAG: amidohydrolase/deacetylase family metallohydrolase [Solirubrobacteraceae bacterium]
MKFDLLIRGGEVVDPATGARGLLDVAVSRGRVADVAPDIPSDSAFRVIDAAEQIVTPGLVDLHAHVFHGATYWGVRADPIAASTGVTTWIDAGSPGALTLDSFRQSVVRPAEVRIATFLNISYIGLVGPDYELANLNYCDVDVFRRVCDLNRDLVVGVKVRMGATTVGESGIEPLRRAREAADDCELPLMMHIASGPPTVDECLPFLKSGDIVTHCFTPFDMRIVEEGGRLRKSARDAIDRGVILDVGHGSGALSFEVAENLIAQGWKPDVISTDVHQLSVRGPMFDLPTCMSKFLCLGMDLEEVVRAATIRPAEVVRLGEGVGSLAPGAPADIALFALESGDFRFYDVNMDVREGDVMLRNTLTVVGGRPMSRVSPDPPAPWVSEEFLWPSFHAELVRKQWEKQQGVELEWARRDHG